MSIQYNETKKMFLLDTPNTSYRIGIFGSEKIIGHIYYGKRIHHDDIRYLADINNLLDQQGEQIKFRDSFAFEYPTAGIGDYRQPCLKVKTVDGHHACNLSYMGYRIVKGKYALPGLPATFAEDESCDTLEIYAVDMVLGLDVTLIYGVFQKLDVITRSVRIQNHSSKKIYLTSVLSSCLDMENDEYEMLTLDGSWAKERMITRRDLVAGRQAVISNRGESSHQANPFLALISKGASQDSGEVYAMNLVYSGNFLAQAERTQYNTVRAVMGILPEDFCWKLNSGEEFIAPETVLVYSDQGLAKMTHTFHDLYRNHLIRGVYRDTCRPVLINNWEATYFQFDTEKLLEIAKEAAKQGIELFVLDDGWFGKRENDGCALGDWYVNEEKLSGGLSYLADQINQLGMKFGLWFEPEMISPDSDLYRAHPDWAIQIPERTPAEGRKQLVLDITRKEVRDAIYNQISKILHSANIEYVKWDMNRNLSDLGSCGLEPDCQGELSHRYVLALYEMQERLVLEFPNLLLENCSSGGGRFDAGMLYYSPQIWCSDNTDAIERLRIQEGTALVYPLSTMGAHISVCPNHQNGRITPFETRGYVAMAGTFGYELDITQLSESEREKIPSQIEEYHQYNELIRTGDYYRLESFQENHEKDCYMIVSKDQTEAVVFCFQIESLSVRRPMKLRMKGFRGDWQYELVETKKALYGDTYMNAGILLELPKGDYQAKLLHLKAILPTISK